ncbi:phosphatase PAP2 family protein [Deinococcus sonorensis]|uniref:Phosphatase PAP2 family protein n=2 Tax=Deinococcus sonorensis TaxID=309891 RepID=A0AAU7U691_9DEIO
MSDPLQHALHSVAVHSPLLSALAVFCAASLLFVLIAVFVVLGLTRVRRVTWLQVARMVASLGIAGLLTLVLKHLVHDPRPFMVEHYAPLTHASSDNGFPSDHTLIAALLAGWVWWLDRRWLALFIVGVLLVMLGRLAIGAHHTLDVLGSLAFAGLGLALAALVLFSPAWERPVLPGRPPKKGTPT